MPKQNDRYVKNSPIIFKAQTLHLWASVQHQQINRIKKRQLSLQQKNKIIVTLKPPEGLKKSLE